MRIAIIADPVDEQHAGVHFYAKEVIQALLRNDRENQYVFIHACQNPFFDTTENYIVPNHRNIRAYASWRIFYLIPKLLKKLNVDAVWDLGHTGPFNLPKRIIRLNTILDLTPVLLPSVHLSFSTIVHKVFLPLIVRNSTAITCYSYSTMNDLVRLYPKAKGKVTMIHLGKDPMFVPTSRPDIPKKYHIDAPYILYLGTIEPRKNVACLVEAYNQMRANTDLKHKLVIAGKKGWKYEQILEKIDSSPYRSDIIMTDYVTREDMPALYSAAEVFVFPSIYEGFGLPLLEAMACGTACISSNASSLPEVGGDAVLYFDPSQPAELADRLVQILSAPGLKKDLQHKSVLQASLFSWDSYAKKAITWFSTSANEKNSFWQLLWVIAANDFKLRYYGSYLGYLWSLLKPLSLFCVMWFVFSTFVRWDIVNYQLYLLLGIMIWNFFTESTTMGLLALASKISIIKKVYFPRIIVVLASTVSAFIGLFFNLLVFFIFALLTGLAFTPYMLLFPLILLPLYVFSMGISLLLAGLFIKFRDINQVWEVLLQVGFWLSPIVYPLHFVPEKYQFALLLNPITGIIQYARLLLIEGSMPSLLGILYVYLAALVLFCLGFLVFSRFEPLAAEEL